MNFGRSQTTQAAAAEGTASGFDLDRPLPSPTVVNLRSSHHNMARLLAEGRQQVEVALITGYSPGYISRLVNDNPTFQGLLKYYTDVAEVKLVDALERMKSVGIDALEELQARLADDPKQFTINQLQEITELMLMRPAIAGIKAGSGGFGGGAAGASAQISISFKAPEAESQPMITIEGELAESDREAASKKEPTR